MSATISTHVLDAAIGEPASDVTVSLAAADGRRLATGQTDADGRLAVTSEPVPAGTYTLTFDSAAYFQRTDTPTFYPRVDITFTVPDTAAPTHLHVPVLLSPFAYSTYRGS